jgi:hypothetical protein
MSKMENRSEVTCGRFARCQGEEKIVCMGETAVKTISIIYA